MKSIEQICKSVIENIHSSIEEDWIEATLVVRVEKNFSSYSGTYHTRKDEIENIKVSSFHWEVDDDLIELHRITVDELKTQDPWNTATFITTPDGEWQVSYEWDEKRHQEVYGRN